MLTKRYVTSHLNQYFYGSINDWPIHLLLVLALLFCASRAFGESTNNHNPQQAEAPVELPPLPPAEVEKDEQKDDEQENKSRACQAYLNDQEFETRYAKLKANLERDYSQGLPKKLHGDLSELRDQIDQLSMKLFEVDKSNTQEMIHSIQLILEPVEKMIALLPKANSLAPKMRDEHIVPLTNINSLKAEHQECLMQAAIEEVQNSDVKTDKNEKSGNIYRRLTAELKRLNNDLYTLQTTDVQRYIGMRANLMAQLEKLQKGEIAARQVAADMPKVLNTMHREIEALLPGLELSKNYYSIAQ